MGTLCFLQVDEGSPLGAYASDMMYIKHVDTYIPTKNSTRDRDGMRTSIGER